MMILPIGCLFRHSHQKQNERPVMETDFAKQLRDHAYRNVDATLMQDAADEIERLQNEIMTMPEIEMATPEYKQKALGLFDKTRAGALDEIEIHALTMLTMPYLLDDGRKADLAHLIARLLTTIDDLKKGQH